MVELPTKPVLDKQHMHYKSHYVMILTDYFKKTIVTPLKTDEKSEWCSSFVCLNKPNGEVRLCIDPSKLNDQSYNQYMTCQIWLLESRAGWEIQLPYNIQLHVWTFLFIENALWFKLFVWYNLVQDW